MTRRARSIFARFSLLALHFLVVAPSMAASSAFYQTWGDGKGEINVYKLTEERYHEPRQGHAVLVYVTEELNADTHVKVESDATPPNKRMYVLKLNSLRKFTTGLYDYSTMTSVFSVPESYLGHEPFTAARVTHTTQEWCGQVFERLDLRKDGFHRVLHSYFEREGDVDQKILAPKVELEDNLWIKVRELDGPWLAVGESRELDLFSSAWERRKEHSRPEPHRVIVTKRDAEPIETGLGTIPAYIWTWTIGDRQVSIHVEAEGAHRVLGWEDSHGGTAVLESSERLAYWTLNDDHQFTTRLRFKLPDEKLLP